ncbi:methyl-accepting chemotaxis protein [Anaerobranca gottschalkii]|uniref:Methyl-accepting chemotaxis protein n=1 Tax=Anaerobranca gottschalkii DSM 13577 TaxID=1120990 RepID=A0A1I0BXN9_9FIRM|nr:methyl-accepting chemotaxis protein [Anaerobranca gottschalkii]SET11859.1 methyl-accepting chemotaxis protein [Anaerobranca gottschalkii DSM 13577]
MRIITKGKTKPNISKFSGIKLGLSNRIILIYLLTSIVLVAGISLQVYNSIYGLLRTTSLQSNAQLALEVINARYPGNWRVEGDRLYKGATLINENYELVDTIKRSTRGEITIFARDTSVATTIRNDGIRQIGTKASEEVVEQVLKRGESYSGTVNIFGESYNVHYMELRDIAGNIVGMFFIGYPRSYILELVSEPFRKIVFVALGIMGGTILIYYLYLRFRVTKPVERLRDNIQKMAAGDLRVTTDLKLLKRKDEIGEMAQGFAEMVKSIRSIVEDIQGKANQLNISSESLASTSSQMSASSQELASTMNQVAEGSANQAQDLEGIVTSLSDLTVIIDKVNRELENVKEQTENTQNKAHMGREEMDNLVQSITEVKKAFQLVADKLEGLNNTVQEISGISELISSISEQTNLLALNAAIEAARAGEQGRGFAVVADEVRKLAEESRTSTEKIINLVESITKDTEEVITTSKTVEQSVEEQVYSVDKTVNSFGEILQSVDSIKPLVTNTYQAMDEIMKFKDLVIEKAEEVSAITEETTAATEEVAASSQELTASSEEVANTAQSLREIAKGLMERVNTFKI